MLYISRILGYERVIHKPFQQLLRNWHKERLTPVAWEKPKIGWTKLNFDGSCKCKTGKSSIGGIFRNHEAEFLLGYAESIGKTNSTIAELTALSRGLELIIENGWNDVWLEGDSKSLVDVIVSKRVVRCKEVQKQISHINLLIPEIKSCIITHIFREGNRAADKFAQMGHHLKKPQIWRDIPPNQVLRIVKEDAEGKTFFRRR
ncbi:putative ribonuclease h protein [Nicotiana attenuata]|uniref:Ribonuclease h protein n=1 Tax=Nicotiana attenuata TaxID=49451 RepID=A0A314KMR0_NICAT|nr:putative ribonuclease h protein [Nicotiana attenuata]